MVEQDGPRAGKAETGRFPAWAGVYLACLGLALALGLAYYFRLLATRPNSFEVAAVANLHSFVVAQAKYHEKHRDESGVNKYASSIRDLRIYCMPHQGAPDRGHGDAIDPYQLMQGYYYDVCRTIGGKPIDWRKDFAICGASAAYNRTGRRMFIVRTDGVVYGKDPRLSDGSVVNLVDDFPVDPEAAGWERVD